MFLDNLQFYTIYVYMLVYINNIIVCHCHASNLQCWLLDQMCLKSYHLISFIYVKLLCHNFIKACNKIGYLKKLFITFYSLFIQFQFLSGYMFFSVWLICGQASLQKSVYYLWHLWNKHWLSLVVSVNKQDWTMSR